MILAIEDCLRYPDRCIIIVGPTLKQTTEIVAPRMKRIAEDAPSGLVKRTKSESKWYIGDSELVVGGFDQNSSSQRGKTVQNIYVEEVVDSDPDSYNESMRSDLGPALTHSDGGRMIFLTTPPKIPDHPFITDTMSAARLTESLYTYTIDDNEALTPEQYQRCVNLAGGKDTVDFHREYLCEIVRDPNMVVLPDYNEERHVSEFNVPPQCLPQTTGDWGGVRDMTVMLLHTYDFMNDLLLIIDEIVFPANTNTDIIMAAREKMEAQVPYIHQRNFDTPGQLRVDLHQLHGMDVAPPPKDDFRASINNLAVGFHMNKVKIHKRCKFLRETCRSGMFNKQKTDFARTQSLGHCDALAALMYANRTQNRERPWAEGVANHQEYFTKEAPVGRLETVAAALQPKKFGQFNTKRRF